MKKEMLLGALIALSVGTQASAKTVETIVTCSEDDGDQYFEVGIVMNDGPGYSALIVRHNADDNSSRLVATVENVKRTVKGSTLTWANVNGLGLGDTFILTVKQVDGGYEGKYTLLEDGHGGVNRSGKVDCELNSSITYAK